MRSLLQLSGITIVSIRRGALSVLVVATMAVAGSALSVAAPPSWDIQRYDDCLGQVQDDWLDGGLSDDDLKAAVERCCVESGGEVGANLECHPPAAAGDAPAPPRLQLPGVDQQTLPPAPEQLPPGVIAPPMAPAPGTVG